MVTRSFNAQVKKLSASVACLLGYFSLSAQRTGNGIGYSSFDQTIVYSYLVRISEAVRVAQGHGAPPPQLL